VRIGKGRIRCDECGLEMVAGVQEAWAHLTDGWVPVRSGGGANAVRLPVFDGRHMCKTCWLERVVGGEQGTLDL
jgi:hypothetical protein